MSSFCCARAILALGRCHIDIMNLNEIPLQIPLEGLLSQMQVLASHFPGVRIAPDVAALESLPRVR
jgi:hypothetical protein